MPPEIASNARHIIIREFSPETQNCRFQVEIVGRIGNAPKMLVDSPAHDSIDVRGRVEGGYVHADRQGV